MIRSVQRADDPEAVQAAVAILQGGGVVAHPTETVYGLGARMGSESALARLRSLKGRSRDEPFIFLVLEEWLDGLVEDPPPLALQTIEAFWPGPLTLLLPAGPGVPRSAQGPDGRVALRATDHPLCQRLLEGMEEPFASTSANCRGAAPASTVEEVRAAFAETPEVIDLLLDAGPLLSSPPSSIVAFAGHTWHLVREGAVKRAAIRELLGSGGTGMD